MTEREKKIALAVQQMIQERCSEDNVLASPSCNELADFLQKNCLLSEQTSQALAWAEKVDLSSTELEKLASLLSFEPNLLGDLLNLASEEALHHSLLQVADNMDSDNCSICADLETQIRDNSNSTDELAIEVLDHLVVQDDIDEDFQETVTMIEPLLNVFANLNHESQTRILAFALQEAGGKDFAANSNAFKSYARLRQGYLSVLARRVFDQLALNPEGTMNAEELVLALSLHDKRALGQVQRNVQKALSALKKEGLELNENPLLIKKIGKDRLFILSPDAHKAWTALLKAEANNPLLKLND